MQIWLIYDGSGYHKYATGTESCVAESNYYTNPTLEYTGNIPEYDIVQNSITSDYTENRYSVSSSIKSTTGMVPRYSVTSEEKTTTYETPHHDCSDSNGNKKNAHGENCGAYSNSRTCGEENGSSGFDSNAHCCTCGGGSTTTTYTSHVSTESIYRMHRTMTLGTFSDRFYSLSNTESTNTRTDTIFSHDITYHGGDWVTVPGYWTHVPASCEKDYIHVFKSPLHAAMGGLWMAWDINWWIWFYMSYE